MKNYIQDGDTIDVELTGTVNSGDAALIQNQFVIYKEGGVSGDTVAALRAGVIEYDKETGTGRDWAQFETIYYDESEDRLTDDDATGSNSAVGVAAEDATTSASKGKLIMNVPAAS